MITLFYLHGFNSSPGTFKGRQLMSYIAELGNPPELYVPALPPSPNAAIAKLEQLINAVDTRQLTLIGSSLGGYYATWLAQKYGLRAVLVNPAIHPYEDLRPYVGSLKNLYTAESYDFTEQHLRELLDLKLRAITRPERYLLLVQTGDEVLDYREAVEFYAGATQKIIGGGDHGFQNFEAHIPAILRFAGYRSEGIPRHL